MRFEVNGLHLNIERRGDGPALLALHGFTGSADSWSILEDAWAGYDTIAVDIIGHGLSDSPADPARYSIDHCIDDIAAILDDLRIERTALLGYSMGGRIALRFALRHPERLWALVLESASPGIESAAEREARVESDERLAQMLERDGIEAFVDYWQSIPLWAGQASLPADKLATLREQRLQNSVTGLANSLRGMGAGRDAPVFDQLSHLDVPTLFVTGALDQRYAELSTAMSQQLQRGELQIIEGAGHAAHFEQPDAFANIVTTFLSKHAPVGAKEATT